jgi:hypothetical protein
MVHGASQDRRKDKLQVKACVRQIHADAQGPALCRHVSGRALQPIGSQDTKARQLASSVCWSWTCFCWWQLPADAYTPTDAVHQTGLGLLGLHRSLHAWYKPLQHSRVYSKLAASAHLCGVHLASLQAKVCDRVAAIQVHSCFVIGLCGRHIVLKAACRQESAGGWRRPLARLVLLKPARTPMLLLLLTSRDKDDCTTPFS